MSDADDILLDEGAAKAHAAKMAKSRELEMAKRIAAAKTQELIDERNVFAAMLADDRGISTRRIAMRMFGTSDWTTAKKAIEAGRALRDTSQADEPAEKSSTYRYDAETGALNVFLTHAEFEPYMANLPVEPSKDGEAYTFHWDGETLTPDNPDGEETWLNPVVILTMTEKGKAAAIKFIQSAQ